MTCLLGDRAMDLTSREVDRSEPSVIEVEFVLTVVSVDTALLPPRSSVL